MERNLSHDQRRRSKTRRDPTGDKVYSVPPQDFAHTVQRLTGAATPAPTASSSGSSWPVPGLADSAPSRPQTQPDSAPSRPQTQPPPVPALLVSVPTATGRSMQDAYLAWCDSNSVVLSPGTMAEIMEHQIHGDS
ncbi:hypothetical protein EJB05_23160, partial [Eragrostis curvula]